VTYDLNPTLPSGVRGGGRFAVDPRGTPLPPGVALSVEGVLSVTAQAAPGEVNGVVFVYEEPES